MKLPLDVSSRIKQSAGAEDTNCRWTGSSEDSWLMVLEAYRRYLEVTQDPRQAAGLTLAWASLEGGSRAGSS